jgi:hypothetical protein
VKERNNGLDDLLQRRGVQDTDLCDHETPIGREELPGTCITHHAQGPDGKARILQPDGMRITIGIAGDLA